ncbi:hypothetical protein GH769_10815 [Pseudomonas sp. CFSAN084952]|uniref:hypothetical protein n=1 Tax=Pseudomonas TaxID=286 RepID=UPI000D368429|nr:MULTISPECIES: hypothetical protein [unclassified Pseudomonas]PTT11544.1 hypothetical protein DBR14_13045 [Pseudomonas sp. HMWF034]PVV70669.1 hypothetical protein DD985_15095 [Pseudomonas sp. HMWF011]QGF93712.1 hypothetical protein GH769_10815 [Pseudomonas sp. CFSAN084952]
MKEPDWIELGDALTRNAPFLEALAMADEDGVALPERRTKGISFLMSKGLIEEDDELYYLSGLLLDVGAQISLQGFGRAAPDLKESLIAIEQHCEVYRDAKAANSSNEAEQHLKRLTYSCRQVTNHLRNEQAQTRAFIEGGYGFSPRLRDRLRDINNAINRLKRLHENLGLFTHVGLSSMAGSDRSLRRVLLDNLLGAVSRNRLALDEMIGRLDRLSLAVRKRNHMRQIAHAVDLFLQAGNPIDLEPLFDGRDAAAWAPAVEMTLAGSAYCDVDAGESLEQLELLIASLPPPKERRIEQPAKARESKAVKPAEEAPKALEKPFARDHLMRMLVALNKTNQAQSAVAYWSAHGDSAISISIWLYALDGYVRLQSAVAKVRHKPLNYRLNPTYAPYPRISANRRVIDLILERAERR